jgi:hypothetical protein
MDGGVMLGFLTRLRDRAVVTGTDPVTVPAEIALAIDSCSVQLRGVPDPEAGEQRTAVRVPGVGHWAWDGTDDAAQRFMRTQGLSDPVARKAAKLLGATIAREVRDARRARHAERRRTGFAWDW